MFSDRPVFISFILALSCLVGAVLVSTQSPRVIGTSLNENIENQRYSLTFSTTLIPEEVNVSITPEMPINVTTFNREIYIDFLQPLQYATDYTFKINVKDTRQKTSAIERRFTTRNPNYYYLTRNDNEIDEIIKASVTDSSADEIVYEHEAIVDYQVAESSILAIVNENDLIALQIVSGTKVDPIMLPEGYTYQSVDGSRSSEKYIFTLNNKDYEASAWMYDAKEKRWILAAENIGSSLNGATALFAPDGKSVYYFDTNKNLILDDPSDDRALTVLGSYDAILRFLPNQKAIFLIQNNLYKSLSAGGETTEGPNIIKNVIQPQKLNTDGYYAYIKILPDPETRSPSQQLTLLRGEEETPIASALTIEQLFITNTLSPNDEFIATEQAAQPVIYDATISNSKPKDTITVIRSTYTGERLRTLNGFDVIWR